MWVLPSRQEPEPAGWFFGRLGWGFFVMADSVPLAAAVLVLLLALILIAVLRPERAGRSHE